MHYCQTTVFVRLSGRSGTGNDGATVSELIWPTGGYATHRLGPKRYFGLREVAMPYVKALAYSLDLNACPLPTHFGD